MTRLSRAAADTLAQDKALRKLLGRSVSYPTWIFDQRPVKVAIEGTQTCMIVVNELTQYTSPNDHNTLAFPRLIVDIWADPTREAPGGAPTVYDAPEKVEAIAKLVNRHFHLVDSGTASGGIVIWGTAEEIAARTGVAITGSKRLDGPDYSDVRDSEGSVMGRLTFGVNAL